MDTQMLHLQEAPGLYDKKASEILTKKFVKDQLERWKLIQSSADTQNRLALPVITVSAEPGSHGSILAKLIAEQLDYDFFNRVIVKKIAQSLKLSTTIIESVEKNRFSGIEDFLADGIIVLYNIQKTFLVE